MLQHLRSIAAIAALALTGVTIHAQLNRAVIVKVNGEAVTHLDIEAELGNLARDYVRSGIGLDGGRGDEGKALMASLLPTAAIRLVDWTLIAQRGRAMGLKAPEASFPTAVEQMMKAMGARTREELDKALAREGGSIADVRRVWERSALMELTLRSQLRGSDAAAFETFMQPLRAAARLEWQRADVERAFAARGYTHVTGALLAANEGSAILALRQIMSAQIAYASACTSGQYAASFDNLTKGPDNQPFISPDLKAAGTQITRSGYRIILVPDGPVTRANTCTGDAAVAAGFTVFAVPTMADVSGIRSFAMSEAGTIYHNFGGPISSVRGGVKPVTARPIG